MPGADTRAGSLATALVLLAVLFAPSGAHAQRPVVGFLASTQVTAEVREAFVRGLGEQGYREKDVEVLWRAADGDAARARSAADELVGRKVNVLVTVLTPAAMAAKNATRDIPIVLAYAGDPVATGLVSSLARPEGNITGLSGNSVELSGKRIEVLREAIPGMKQLGLMILGTDPFAKPFITETGLAARKLGMRLHVVDVRSADKVDAAMAELKKRGAQGVLVQGALTATRWRAAELALRHRLPSMSPQKRFAGDGGMMYYGASLAEGVRRSAFYVHRILNGAKPGDLSIEQPTRFELVINNRTARSLGIAIPQQLLQRADNVIE